MRHADVDEADQAVAPLLDRVLGGCFNRRYGDGAAVRVLDTEESRAM